MLPFEPLSTCLSVDNLAADLAEPRLALSYLRLTRSTAAVDERATVMGPDRARHAHERPELSTGLADDAAEDSGFRLSVRFPTASDPPYRLLAEPLPVSCSVLPCVFHGSSPPSIPAVAPASTGCCGFAGPGPSAALDGHGKVSPWPGGTSTSWAGCEPSHPPPHDEGLSEVLDPRIATRIFTNKSRDPRKALPWHRRRIGKGGDIGRWGRRWPIPCCSECGPFEALRLLPRRHVAACGDVLITPSGERDDAHSAG